MHPSILVRAVRPADYSAWKPLWDGYNVFYGRQDERALPDEITQTTWQRFLNPDEPVFALVAERQGQIVGLGALPFSSQHYSRSTNLLPSGFVHASIRAWPWHWTVSDRSRLRTGEGCWHKAGLLADTRV